MFVRACRIHWPAGALPCAIESSRTPEEHMLRPEPRDPTGGSENTLVLLRSLAWLCRLNEIMCANCVVRIGNSVDPGPFSFSFTEHTPAFDRVN